MSRPHLTALLSRSWRPLLAVPVAALLALPARPALPSAPTDAVVQDDDRKAEFAERFEAAEGDREALWELHTWCDALGMKREAKKVLRAILDVDDGDAKAHELLGHVFYDGQWFTTEKKYLDYKKKKEEAEAKEKGLVRFKDGWVDPADIPYLERGMVKDDAGNWVDPEVLERIEAGWVRQDFTWVSPEEKEKMEQGLWKVGEEWMSLEDANTFHSTIGHWWHIPGENFELLTTVPRETAEQAMDEMDKAAAELEKFYGTKPATPPRVLLLNSIDQYNQFASDGYEGFLGEPEGLSSAYTGFIADLWWDLEAKQHTPAGVSYWDPSDETTNRFGRHAARFAAGLAFGQGVDPSADAARKLSKKIKPSGFKPSDRDIGDYYEGKRVLPPLFYGAATYVERYFIERTAAQGGDPHWARHWSVSNIDRRGGLDPLDKVFSFRLSVDSEANAAQAGKLINQSGLVVSFILDGECEPVKEAHAAWKEAFASGNDLEAATNGLVEALLEHEAELRQYAKS